MRKTSEIPFRIEDRGHTTPCWIWQRSKDKKGYGRYYAGRAHRFIYELVVGPIREDLQLDHLCRVRDCVNPNHLEQVTNRDNVIRGMSGELSKIRASQRTHCKNGHPFTPENTYIGKAKCGRVVRRECRTCMRESLKRNRRQP